MQSVVEKKDLLLLLTPAFFCVKKFFIYKQNNFGTNYATHTHRTISSHEILAQDLEAIINDPKLSWQNLEGKTVLITGASGQIGSALVKTLLAISQTQSRPLFVIAHGRKKERLAKVLEEQLVHLNKNLIFAISDLTEELSPEYKPDFIIHTASVTSSQDFIDKPVETINTNLKGTINVLELGRKVKSKSIVFVSTMEVYGDLEQELASEDHCGLLDHLVLRNSYPCSKRLAEMLCMAYVRDYDLNIQIVRPTLTFGAALQNNDSRVYAQFARSFLEKKPLVLHTEGRTQRDYLYLYDAVHWILSVLLLGQKGEVYNLSNPETYCSIREMAELVAHLDPEHPLEIQYDLDPEKNKRYFKEIHKKLDTRKIMALNQFPLTSLRDCYTKMLILTQEREKCTHK